MAKLGLSGSSPGGDCFHTPILPAHDRQGHQNFHTRRRAAFSSLRALTRKRAFTSYGGYRVAQLPPRRQGLGQSRGSSSEKSGKGGRLS